MKERYSDKGQHRLINALAKNATSSHSEHKQEKTAAETRDSKGKDTISETDVASASDAKADKEKSKS